MELEASSIFYRRDQEQGVGYYQKNFSFQDWKGQGPTFLHFPVLPFFIFISYFFLIFLLFNFLSLCTFFFLSAYVITFPIYTHQFLSLTCINSKDREKEKQSKKKIEKKNSERNPGKLFVVLGSLVVFFFSQ